MTRRSRLALFVSVIVMGFLAPGRRADAVSVTRGPYLQSGSTSQVVVRWRTDSSETGRVTYGLVQGDLQGSKDETSSRTEHVVTITGLAANTKYYYAIGNSGGQVRAGNDANHYFTTSPTVGPAQPTRVWVIGDSGTKDSSARNVRDQMLSWTSANPWLGSSRPDLWLMLGDNAYSVGNDTEYQNAVFDMYPTILRNMVLWPCLGNHDAGSADSPTESGVYYDIFTLPRQAEAGGTASGTEAYYSYDYANIHFIVLDSHDTSRNPADPMLTWAKQDAGATNQDWIIAYWHHPPYTKGSHDSDSEGRLIDMRQNALPILEDAGVDLVLTGHSHCYERSYLLDGAYGNSTSANNDPANAVDNGDGRDGGDGAYQKPTAGLTPHEGTVYIVDGASGNARGGDPNRDPHPVNYTSLYIAGSVILDIDGLRMDGYYIDPNGNTADYWTIIKGASDSIAPTVLQATASGDPFAVEIIFSERVEPGTGPGGAENPSNYSVAGFTVVAATLGSGGRTVTLTLNAPMTDATSYSVTVSGVNDRASPPNVLNPPQTVSFTFVSGPVTVFESGDIWKYFKGTSFPGATWTQIGFNDAGWATGATGIGYGDGDDATVLSDMEDSYLTVYLRKDFQVADASTVFGLTFTVDYDDGFVAFLNGTEVARRGVASGQDRNTTASGHEAGTPEVIDLSSAIGALVTGTNVFAIEVHNTDVSSSDLSMIPTLEMLGGQLPPTPDTDPPIIGWSELVVAGTVNDITATVASPDGTLTQTGTDLTWTVPAPSAGGNIAVTATDAAGNSQVRVLSLSP